MAAEHGLICCPAAFPAPQGCARRLHTSTMNFSSGLQLRPGGCACPLVPGQFRRPSASQFRHHAQPAPALLRSVCPNRRPVVKISAQASAAAASQVRFVHPEGTQQPPTSMQSLAMCSSEQRHPHRMYSLLSDIWCSACRLLSSNRGNRMRCRVLLRACRARQSLLAPCSS